MPPENKIDDLSKAGTIPDMLDVNDSSTPSVPVPPPISQSTPPVITPTPITLPPIAPLPPPLPQVAPKEPIDATQSDYLKQIRTYQGDIAAILGKEETSLVSIRAAEKAKQDLLRKSSATIPEDNTANAEETRRKIKSAAFFLCGVLLLGAAGYAAWYSYTTYVVKTAVPTLAIPENRFLPVASTTNINTESLTRQALISLLQNERTKPLPSGNIEHIEFRKGSLPDSSLMNTTEFLLAIDAKPPANLVRAFDPLFMLGILGLPLQASSTEAGPVLMVKIDSYENAYAGMLDWEKDIKEDILPLFVEANEAANVPDNSGFADLTVKNKDARVLLDKDGETVLLYSFYNQKLLIITGSEPALRTILSELDTQALAR